MRPFPEDGTPPPEQEAARRTAAGVPPTSSAGAPETVKDEASVPVERLKRLQAEFENYKKRTAREMAALEERVSDREICALLPAYDSLQRALQHVEQDGDAAAFLDGVRQVAGQFEQILSQEGVARMSCVGERFDPAYHEAVLCIPSEEKKDTILEEFERGYLRSGRVLRPSKVKVSGGSPAAKEGP